MHQEITAAHDSYLRTDKFLRGIPDDMYLGGLLVRDYLLDETETTEDLHEQQLAALRISIEERLRLLEPQMGSKASPAMRRLRLEVQAYWESLEPIFKWTPAQKRSLGPRFLRQRVLPRWQNVVDLANEITSINEANLRTERERLEASQNRLQSVLRNVMAVALVTGIMVAFVSTRQFRVLERRNNSQVNQIAHTEQELRRLSRKLVQAQEDERKFIARELHDALGQMVTAQGMELSALEGVRNNPPQFHALLKDIKSLNREVLTSVRDLAMGLRPSMLDDIGLLPALQWQARQFSRRTGIPVDVECNAELGALRDSHSTCIYRTVQEALTNCAKHSEATRIAIALTADEEQVRVSISDNGRGFDVQTAATGLGLLGMQERVRELAGTFSVSSSQGKGTILTVSLQREGSNA
jgi:signal transduction histidine kinase